MQWHGRKYYVPGADHNSVRLKHKVSRRGINNEAEKNHNGLIMRSLDSITNGLDQTFETQE